MGNYRLRKRPGSQTVNGVTANYTLDQAAGLTQTLSESAPQGYGAHTYLYGLGRIAQVNTDTLMTDYFLTDALGSVRQLTNATGSVTLAKAYDPYGVLTQVSTGSTNASGASQTDYGYTGEFQANDLVYLRARHYAPSMGRFLSRDTWEGDANRPLSFNRWGYVEGNPINLVDPTGMHPGPHSQYCNPLLGTDRLHCERIIRGIDPYANITRQEMILYDMCSLAGGDECCLDYTFPPLYEVLRIPGHNVVTKYQDYGFWFHYLLNEKSLRSGKGHVSISQAIAYALSAEASVPDNYDNYMPIMVRAMVNKGQQWGVYTALGGRQVVMTDLNPFIFFGDLKTPRIYERWAKGWDNPDTGKHEISVTGEAMIQEYIARGRNWESDLGKRAKLLDTVRDTLPIQYTGNPNDVPIDWGNATSHGLSFEKFRTALLGSASSWNASTTDAAWDKLFWRSDPTGGHSDGIDHLYILTTNQERILCDRSCFK